MSKNTLFHNGKDNGKVTRRSRSPPKVDEF